jgi:uncharacterized membrane protein SirB2
MKKILIRLIVKGYVIPLLFGTVLFIGGVLLLLAPLFPNYIYHESHLGGALIAMIIPVVVIGALAIPTKQDRRDGLV